MSDSQFPRLGFLDDGRLCYPAEPNIPPRRLQAFLAFDPRDRTAFKEDYGLDLASMVPALYLAVVTFSHSLERFRCPDDATQFDLQRYFSTGLSTLYEVLRDFNVQDKNVGFNVKFNSETLVVTWHLAFNRPDKFTSINPFDLHPHRVLH